MKVLVKDDLTFFLTNELNIKKKDPAGHAQYSTLAHTHTLDKGRGLDEVLYPDATLTCTHTQADSVCSISGPSHLLLPVVHRRGGASDSHDTSEPKECKTHCHGKEKRPKCSKSRKFITLKKGKELIFNVFTTSEF